LSKESTYIISEILADGYRPNLNGHWEHAKGVRKVAFKTGTSSRSKHLYGVGYTPKYTVAVWFGNFDGKETFGGRTGSNTSLGVLLDIFNLIERENSWFEKPTSITTKKVCNEYFSTDNCQSLVEDKVFTQPKCLSLDTQKVEFLVKKRHKKLEDIIAHPCYKELKTSNPMIISPVSKVYEFSKNIPKEYRVLKMQCQSFDQQKMLLFLNNKIVENGSYIPVDFGNHSLLCYENEERFSEVEFKVKELD